MELHEALVASAARASQPDCPAGTPWYISTDMTLETIRCPKCSHAQTNQVECEACGLLFRKFEQVQAREKEEKSAQSGQSGLKSERSGSATKIGSVLALVVVTAALTYVLASSNRPESVPPPPTQPAETVVAEKVTPDTAAKPAPQRIEQTPAISAGSPLEQAKNGTVAIETPWGTLGSGFFLTDTTIVTNKHVVVQDTSQLDEFRHKVKTSRQLITLEQESIVELRNRLNRMEDGPTRRQLIIILQEKEKLLTRVLPIQKEEEARLKEMEQPRSTSGIKVFLADGSEYTAQSVQVSAKRDLALLSLYSAKAVVLKTAAKGSVLQQGDKVFTIGNPSGLRNTVTSGIFSGYRQDKETGEVILQTDAPINPGNSGGPLIDARGQVYGVNFLRLRDTQGIGFAIPIQAVFEEFSITSPTGQ
ncbi:trypsin-like peptidase domain-containing protein [uncultured Desulfobulbus sp.]|uniref:S1C family serine protease n=1 Tax=uncultured Desulfobulbus sp. TaxID=239745 RepID=UPI0029C91373|nr:trypsin-like peptidase domain-containing protein [uncultured Desulfobulbus sp.]